MIQKPERTKRSRPASFQNNLKNQGGGWGREGRKFDPHLPRGSGLGASSGTSCGRPSGLPPRTFFEREGAAGAIQLRVFFSTQNPKKRSQQGLKKAATWLSRDLPRTRAVHLGPSQTDLETKQGFEISIRFGQVKKPKENQPPGNSSPVKKCLLSETRCLGGSFVVASSVSFFRGSLNTSACLSPHLSHLRHDKCVSLWRSDRYDTQNVAILSDSKDCC